MGGHADTRIIEILTYRLVPNMGDVFHQAMVEESLHLHDRAGIEVLSSGPSLLDGDSYMLIRRFGTVGAMENALQQFYADEAWQNGPRSRIVGSIETSHRIVIDAGSFLSLEY